MTYLNDLLHRLRSNVSWIAAQFWAMALLVLAGIAYTRMPDKYAWQVFLSLLVPVLLIAAFLFLQAETMRRLLGESQERKPLVWGALMLLAWIAVFWAVWAILDWSGDQIPLWAGYLNSRASAHWRASLFTYPHLTSWLTLLVWIFRWIIVPGKIIPYAMASAQWGWRMPMRKLIRMLLNWRWWPAVVLAALASVALPSYMYAGLPHGTVKQQMVAVILKLGGTYLLVIASWVLLLAWASVLLARQAHWRGSNSITELFNRLRLSRHWVAAQFVWVLMWICINVAMLRIPGVERWPTWFSAGLRVSFSVLVSIAALVVQAGMLRSLMSDRAKFVRLVWGSLAVLLWGVLYLIVFSLQDDYLHGQIWRWLLDCMLTPIILFPLAAASAVWGWRLPWQRVLRAVCAWRWWLGVFLAGTVGMLAELYFDSARGWYVWKVDLATGLKMGAVDMLETAVWVLLLGWLAVLFDTDGRGVKSFEAESAPLPLPESDDGGSGNT